MNNKYNAVRSESPDGRSFHSKGERDCYEYLRLLERAGEIDSIESQVTTHLTAGITHKTDFKYWDNKLGETVWAEFKGMEDQRWRDIRKLWKCYGPGRLKVYKGRGTRIYCYEEIIPDGYKAVSENS
jgi:hypothetical protein